MATSTEKPLTPAEAGSFAEHKALRAKPAESKTPTESASPKVEEEAPESVKSSVSETEKPSESAEVSETSPAQEQKKPKRSDAESRIKELLADRDRTAAENAELKKKLDELAARPIETARPAEAKVDAPKAAPQGEPDLDQYLKTAPAEEPYAKTVDRFTKDYLKYLTGQQQKTAVEAKAQESAQASVNAAIAKHGRDTLAAIIGTKDNPNSGLVMAPGVLKTFIDDYGQEGWDTLVHLHGNQEEYRRIQAIPSPLRQLNELAFLSRTLTAPKAESTPEKPRITALPVSRVAPPAKQVSGSEISQPKSTGEALSFEEHKRLRKVAKG